MEELLLKEFKKLFLENGIKSFFRYKIDKIEENFGEYRLNIRVGNAEIKGIFMKTKDKLVEGQTMDSVRFSLDKSNEEIKVYIKKFDIIETEEENKNKTTEIQYNFNPEFLKNSIDNLKLFEGELNDENVFIFDGDLNDKIKLFDPIKVKYYYMEKEYIKNLNLKHKEFIYLKFHIIKNKDILCNNLTFIQKANEYQIFSIIDKSIEKELNPDFLELEEIKGKYKEKYLYIFSKVIFKCKKDNYILVIDKFNNIIKLNFDEFSYLDLFDLLLIIDCEIIKDPENKYYYNLLINKEKSLIYQSKTLILNKKISINNYSILNINIPDYKKENNYYDHIIFSEHKIKVKKKQNIFVIKFNNEIFNEIIPFTISVKNKLKQSDFKFFIVNNIMNNINIFLNYSNDDRCSKEYCYYNFYCEIPYEYKIKINEKIYSINHYNSFDNSNIIGFILINAPSDENTNKIKKYTKKEIISSQIWLTAQKGINKINYNTTQILDIDEAKPKTYLSYNLKKEKYSIFENFYFNMTNYYNEWNSSQSEVFKYYTEVKSKFDAIDKNEYKIIEAKNQIDFIPDSADFYTFKIFTNLLLLDALVAIEYYYKDEKDNIYYNWQCFLEIYIKLIEQLNDLGKLLTYHQKLRIIDSYVDDIFNTKPYNYKSRFLYIDDKFLFKDNSYLLAFKFNVDIIKQLTIKSALTKGFMQLDSYILKNYFIIDESVRNEKNYSLINEPIQLMKYHLLLNYENFIIIKYKNKYKNKVMNAYQDNSNRVTFINEKKIFDEYNSEKLIGKDNALPISIEFLHENFHSKKNSRNIDEKTSLTFFKDNEKKLLEKQEDGRYIESILGDNKFISDLKNPKKKLGNLMKIEYFTDENFDNLHEKYQELIKINNNNSENESENEDIDYDKNNTNKKEKEKKFDKKEKDLKTLEDFEKYYLVNGEFVYPDSIPFHIIPLGQKFVISEAEKQYLEKYKVEEMIKEEEELNKLGKRNISI